MQQGKGVARAVAWGQHHVIRIDLLATGEHHTTHAHGLKRAVEREVHHARLEANFAAQRNDLGAHFLHHAHEPKCADVGLAHPLDFFRRTCLDEFGQHLAREVARVTDLAPQLAIRKRSCAALAELHVRFRVEHALAPQAPGVFRALAHGFAAFQHHGAKTHLR